MCHFSELIWKDAMVEGEAKGRAEGRAEGEAKGRIATQAETLRTVMSKMHCDADVAMDFLDIPEVDRAAFKPVIDFMLKAQGN